MAWMETGKSICRTQQKKGQTGKTPSGGLPLQVFYNAGDIADLAVG